MDFIIIDDNDKEINNVVLQKAPIIQQVLKEYINYEKDGKACSFKLNKEIDSIIIASEEALNDIAKELKSYFIRESIPDNLFQLGKSLTSERFSKEKKNFIKVTRSGLLAFILSSPKNINLNQYSIKLKRGRYYIFISPEAIRKSFNGISSNLDGNDHNDLLSRFVFFVLVHEFSHAVFSFSFKGYEQIAEGLANWLPYMIFENDYQTRHILAEFATRQDFRYNHYIYMLKLKEFPTILERMFDNLDEGAVKYINQLGGKVTFRGGEMLGRRGSINGFIGFGQKGVNITTGGVIEFVGNIQEGTIIASEINEIVGRLPVTMKIFTNHIRSHNDYQTLPNHIKIISKEDVNFAEEIPKLNNESLGEFKKRLISNYL